MPIPIRNPRTVSLVLADYGKKDGGYRFSKELKAFLVPRGWAFVKESKEYVTLTPPAGVKKPFRITVEIPTQEQIEEIARERHAAGQLWAGKLGDWPAVYYPFQAEAWRSTGTFNPFTGEQIDNEVRTGSMPARFRVGYLLFWDAEVTFDDSRATYYESESEAARPEPPSLFDTDSEPEPPKPTRNPPWQRDELILALDLYMQHSGKYLSESDPAIVALSEVLNALPIHTERAGDDFRNPNGASMKLLNFRRFDPTQPGTGLTRGNKLEEEVWNEYAGDPERLHQIAERIKAGYKLVEPAPSDDLEEEGFPEGRILFRLHRLRERNRSVIEKAKAAAKAKHGRLACCICDFDFAAVYGSLGEDFIEGHHTKPLADLEGTTETKPSEIALVCANCHRMLHRKRPWLGTADLRSLLAKKP